MRMAASALDAPAPLQSAIAPARLAIRLLPSEVNAQAAAQADFAIRPLPSEVKAQTAAQTDSAIHPLPSEANAQAAAQADSSIHPFPSTRREPFKPRGTGRAWKGVEGRAAAGPPIAAVPEDERRILVPVKFTGEQYFIVQAEGDSMTGVVSDGDYCVFNKRGVFDNGRIVLAQVDGATDQPDATIKRIYRRPGSKVELRSENPKYPPMLYPAEEVVLMGELIAVLPQSAVEK
jgi:SOS-response transcriptional repressor LexA